MKLFAIITYIFLICLLILGAMYAWNNYKVQEEVRQLPPFNSIYSGGLMNVYLQKGRESSVKIRVDENILDQVITEVIDGQLRIYTEGTIRRERIKDAYVVYTDLDSLHAGGVSTLTSNDLIQSPHFKMAASGAAELRVQLQADSSQLFMSGAANVQLAGGANHFEFQISNLGDLMAYNFQTNHCTARVITGQQSPGVARINVKETLDATIHGPRYIYYKGDPEIKNQSVRGTGKLVRK